MIEIETRARRWGNSIGIALPRDVVERANIKPDKEVKIFIQEENVDLSKVFGSLKIKEDTQKILDEIREGDE